jgi:hypothetical protein
MAGVAAGVSELGPAMSDGESGQVRSGLLLGRSLGP